MLTVFKEIFTWWNHQTFGTRLQTIFFGKLVGKDKKVINTIKIKMANVGLFTMEKLKHRKYLMNGIHGCITQIIKLKTNMN